MPPLHLSSNFTFEGFARKRPYDCTRSANPTRDLLGEAIAELEGAAGGFGLEPTSSWAAGGDSKPHAGPNRRAAVKRAEEIVNSLEARRKLTAPPERGAPMPDPWPWPDALDAVIAAPKHHVVLLENEHVRVLETRIEPGETVPLHTHRWPSAYHVLSWGDFVRRDGDGKVLADTRGNPGAQPPTALWAEPLPPHTLENVDVRPIHVVSVELKRRPSA